MSSQPSFPVSRDAFAQHYKTVTTSRGFRYRYYFSAPLPGRPSVLLIHTITSLAVGLFRQANYFRAKGYGIVVPDLLGYGGTDKPVDVTSYVQSGIARDLIDILDNEGVEDVIVFAHAWYALIICLP